MNNSKCVYYKEKEQKSIDGGITWVDTGNFRKGALISTQASQCGSFVTEYRWTKADYVCDNANKYKGYKQQVSHDNGGSWVDTGVVDIGELIESNSKDCGYDEQWFVMTGDSDFICDGAAKYKKKEMKYTRDSGTTWNSFDTPRYEKGELIEQTSTDCASMKVIYTDGTTKYFTGLTSIDSSTVPNKANVKDVEIYNGVTNIGSSAFYDCTSLTGVTIPDSVTSIGNSAFGFCYGLTGVTIPNSVTSIGQYTFVQCTGLTSIIIPDSVTSIDNSAFGFCYGLTGVTIPNSVTYIGSFAFDGCSSLRTMTVNATTPPTLGYRPIPSTIQRIYVPAESLDAYKTADGWKDYADKIWAIGYDEQWFVLTGDKDFICSEGSKYKKKEMKYTRNSGTTWNSFDPPKYEKGDLIESNSTDCPIPSMKVTYVDGSTKIFYGLTTIDKYTDSNKKNAKSVEIYSGVTSIGEEAFESCTNLTSITIPNSVIEIGENAFDDCDGLTSITIPNRVETFGKNAFYSCSNLKSITIPGSLKTISEGSFYWCRNLTGVTISNGVEVIGKNAFCRCFNLKSIRIPNSVFNIFEGSFVDCKNLKTMTVEAIKPPVTIGDGPILSDSIETIYVPAASVYKYQNSASWKDYADKIQAIS